MLARRRDACSRPGCLLAAGPDRPIPPGVLDRIIRLRRDEIDAQLG
jgi:hypothetical protein